MIQILEVLLVRNTLLVAFPGGPYYQYQSLYLLVVKSSSENSFYKRNHSPQAPRLGLADLTAARVTNSE